MHLQGGTGNESHTRAKAVLLYTLPGCLVRMQLPQAPDALHCCAIAGSALQTSRPALFEGQCCLLMQALEQTRSSRSML